jgi:acyl CoA:acetate/3-ketoacid CoA transferase beta subunit
VLDFETASHTMRLLSVHPGVSVDDIVANTGFVLDIGSDVPFSRAPNESELATLNRLDPRGLRHREVA